MAWHVVDGEVRWLVTEAQLVAYLGERGVTMAADVPVAARWRGAALYSPAEALEFCQASAGDAA